MSNITTIVFDLDGTLVDSSGCIVAAAHHVCRTFGWPLAEEAAIRKRLGQPLGPMLSALFAIDGQDLNQAVVEYSTAYVALAASKERLFPEAISVIQTLRAAGFNLSIATGKSQQGAENAAARLGLTPLFHTIHGILPGTPGTPDPAVLRRAMDSLGVSANECIMVGDTTFDMDLARALQVRTAAVNWGVHSTEKLQGRKPDFFASSFALINQSTPVHI